MTIYTTVLCYTNGEIITCLNCVWYRCLPTKIVVMNTNATFDEFETNVCKSLSIDCMQT